MRAIHDLHVWSLTEGTSLLSAHLDIGTLDKNYIASAYLEPSVFSDKYLLLYVSVKCLSENTLGFLHNYLHVCKSNLK